MIPVVSENELSQKPLPPTHSFCSLSRDNLVISALKKSEEGEGIIVRAFEVPGTAGETPVNFVGKARTFQDSNMLEEGTGREQCVWRFKPFEINTIRLAVK